MDLRDKKMRWKLTVEGLLNDSSAQALTEPDGIWTAMVTKRKIASL